MATADPRPRGARLVHVPDWPFGAGSRRRLLEALLLDEQPQDGWAKKVLEARIGVTNGGLDALLAGAIDIGLAEIDEGRIRHVAGAPDLMRALSSALLAVRELPDRPIHRLPPRPYSR